MKSKREVYLELGISLLLILLGAALRIVPHPANFTPLTAIALFAGARFARPAQALGISLGALFLSDLFLGFHALMPIVYLAFAIMVLMGRSLGTRPHVYNVGVRAMGAGFMFFVSTNFGVWAFDNLYPRNLSGLLECFTAAIPFYRNSLLSDVIFSVALFAIAQQLATSPNLKNSPSLKLSK